MFTFSVKHSIRLFEAGENNTGRVDIWSDNEWNPICFDHMWTASQLSVACHQLGYSQAISIEGNVKFK